MKLMQDDYSYNYTQFYGKTGTIFTITGSRGEKSNSNISNFIDTFKSEHGEYIELKRVDILEQVKLGKMKPVLQSKIELKQYSKKDDVKRRAI